MAVLSLNFGGCRNVRYYIPTKLITTGKTTRRNSLILAITVSVCVIVLLQRHVITSYQTSMTPDSQKYVFPSKNPIPETSVLKTLDVRNVSSLYFRYVNSLQVFCPVKKVYGGVKFGWYTCDIVRMGNPCVAYMIGEQVTDNFFKELKEDYNCEENVIKTSDLKAAQSIFTEPISPFTSMKSKLIIDYMAIDIEDGETRLLSWMLERDLLRNVHQLFVNFHGMRPDSDASVYTEHLQVLRALFEEGFRIFHFVRGVKCLFKPNLRQTGCYSLYMMRNLPRSAPIEVYDVGTTLNKPIRDLSILYNRLLLSTQVHCKQLVRIGNVDDGGWEVCDDPEYRPSPSCLVYSFGVDTDWTFDDEIARVYGCEVHSFDPSIGQQDHKRSDKVTFHNLGLWDRPNGKQGEWDMMSMREIIEMLGHKGKIIDILKMDIEGMEFNVILNMITSGVLKNVRQLDFEFHGGPDFNEDTDDIRSKLKPLRDLHEHGFRIFWSHPNIIEHKPLLKIYEGNIRKFFIGETDILVDKITEMCWFMVMQNPRMEFLIPERGEKFNKDYFKEYDKAGDTLDNVVLPSMVTHKQGSLLASGIVQPIGTKP